MLESVDHKSIELVVLRPCLRACSLRNRILRAGSIGKWGLANMSFAMTIFGEVSAIGSGISMPSVA